MDLVFVLFVFIIWPIFISFVFSIINQSHTKWRILKFSLFKYTWFGSQIFASQIFILLQKIFRWQRKNFSCFSTQIILQLIWFNLVVKNFNLISYCHFYKGSKRFFRNLLILEDHLLVMLYQLSKKNMLFLCILCKSS